MTVAVAIAGLAGLVSGGKLSHLRNLHFRLGWLALVALLMQAGVVRIDGWSGPSAPYDARAVIIVLSYVVLLGVAGWNYRLPGLKLAGLGLLLNFLVIAANGGYMPTTPETLNQAGLAHLAPSAEPGMRVSHSKDVILPREQTRLWFLSDVLVIPGPPPIGAVASVGDLGITAGACFLLYRALKGAAAGALERSNCFSVE